MWRTITSEYTRQVRSVAAVLFTFVTSMTVTACGSGPRPLILATTTSVGSSGLLDVLLPAFERTSGVTASSQLVGSGLALKMLADGNADVAITHAPAAEADALRTHPSWQYRKIMFNRFVLVGPASDPARVREARDAPDAMRRIARSTARFVSRGDGSGTHERERQLWTAAGAAPPDDRLLVAGAGMAATLRAASESGAYTLSDRATFAQLQKEFALAVLLEHGADLLNTYAVTVDPGSTSAGAARQFAGWLSDGNGRGMIEGFRIGAEPAFVLWPAGTSRNSPGDVPR